MDAWNRPTSVSGLLPCSEGRRPTCATRAAALAGQGLPEPPPHGSREATFGRPDSGERTERPNWPTSTVSPFGSDVKVRARAQAAQIGRAASDRGILLGMVPT